MRTHPLLVAAVVAAAVACSKTESQPGSGASEADKGGGANAAALNIDKKAAKEIFDTRCSACHGTDGKGDGPGAAALTPKPRNYTDRTWQKSVTDDQIKKAILLGGAAVGKSPIMPGSPDLDSKPEVVEGLVQIVRQFGKD